MSKFDESSFSMTWDIQIFKLVILLTLSSSKLIVILLNLGKTKLILFVHLSVFGQARVILMSLSKMLGCKKKQSKHPLLDKHFRKYAQGLAEVIFNDSDQSESRTEFPSQ